jgi:cysteine dioxygenase
MQPCKNSEHQASLNLSQFLSILRAAPQALPPAQLSELLTRLQVAPDDLTPWIHFDPHKYARNRVALFSNVEVLVMCWRSGQLTPLHDHKGSACGVRVISGIASEISYKRSNCGALVPVSTVRNFQGDVLSSFDSDIHQVGNLESHEVNLITLHCYSPALTQMQLFKSADVYFGEYESLLERVSACIKRPSASLHLAGVA